MGLDCVLGTDAGGWPGTEVGRGLWVPVVGNHSLRQQSGRGGFQRDMMVRVQ